MAESKDAATGRIISMRLAPEELELLKRVAAERHTTVSATVRRAIFESMGGGTDAIRTSSIGTSNSAATATRWTELNLSRVTVPGAIAPPVPDATTSSK